MAFNEVEIKQIDEYVGKLIERRRPPAHLRERMDIIYRVEGQSFEIFTQRPSVKEPSKKRETAIAKATFVKAKKHWKLFWMRANGKWHGYKPFPSSRSLEEILYIIDEDAYGCFWT